MNTEDFNEEVRRERIESDAAARTLEQEISDLSSDLHDLNDIIIDQAATITNLRKTRQAEAGELAILRAEHEAAVRIVLQLKAKQAMLDPEFVRWMDAHDRTELAK